MPIVHCVSCRNKLDVPQKKMGTAFACPMCRGPVFGPPRHPRVDPHEILEDPFVHAGKWLTTTFLVSPVRSFCNWDKRRTDARKEAWRRWKEARLWGSLAPKRNYKNVLPLLAVCVCLLAVLIAFMAVVGDGGGSGSGKSVGVQGYTRRNGTHVNSYSRSAPGGGSHRGR